MPGSRGRAADLERLARALEPLNGDGRSAAVWSIEGEPHLLYAGRHASKDILDAATAKLAEGVLEFDVDGDPGVRGRVVVCGEAGDLAAYGLFLLGGGRPHLGQTIEQLVHDAERSIGKPVASMSRVEKQEVVRFLDDRGAFLIRKAVEDVADRLRVTRFTIYNYLDERGGSTPDVRAGSDKKGR
jgi:HTH domain